MIFLATSNGPVMKTEYFNTLDACKYAKMVAEYLSEKIEQNGKVHAWCIDRDRQIASDEFGSNESPANRQPFARR
jgi:hypothetical protein